MAVTVGLMMVEANAVVVTHVVQLVADPRQQAPAHDHCADGLGVRLPFNLVAFQAPPQDAHILPLSKTTFDQIERFTLCENDTPQIERYPSVRTIYLRGEEWQVYITAKRRCEKCSVAALLFGVYYKNVLK